MKFEHTNVFNIENAIRGMRNPLNSWDKSDSKYGCDALSKWRNCNDCSMKVCRKTNTIYKIGENDLNLAKRLLKSPEQRKFLRQIFVSIDITAPLYWWKEMDTYKIGTTSNSTSTMHKLAHTPITIDCFEIDDCDKELPIKYGYVDNEEIFVPISGLIAFLEQLRLKYNKTKDKKYWKELIRWLPEGWLQTRTWTANYEVLRNIYNQRKNHKLSEWHTFCDFISTLPYAKEFIIGE